MPILNWLTRDEDIRTAQHVPYRLLEEVPDLSAGDGGAGNMLIQGDNLEALKALLPFYAGRVKCIYIDPPYNTRSAFEHYDDNLEHTQWLAMMWPRIELLRDLLAEDGSIWVSIDDNEGALSQSDYGRGFWALKLHRYGHLAEELFPQHTAPGSRQAATSRSFSSRDQRRRRSTEVMISIGRFVIGLPLVFALGLPMFASTPQDGPYRGVTLVRLRHHRMDQRSERRATHTRSWAMT